MVSCLVTTTHITTRFLDLQPPSPSIMDKISNLFSDGDSKEEKDKADASAEVRTVCRVEGQSLSTREKRLWLEWGNVAGLRVLEQRSGAYGASPFPRQTVTRMPKLRPTKRLVPRAPATRQQTSLKASRLRVPSRNRLQSQTLTAKPIRRPPKQMARQQRALKRALKPAARPAVTTLTLTLTVTARPPRQPRRRRKRRPRQLKPQPRQLRLRPRKRPRKTASRAP